MATTIKDVARHAGVSVATVSRAVNGHANVTARTREHVLGVVERMRFVPSTAARSMVMRRTHAVGALLPDLHGEYFSELIRGIDLAARARGLHLLVSSSHGDAAEAAAALRAMHGRVDGLLVMSPHASADFLWDNLSNGLPAVLMNTRLGGGAHSSFAVDNRAGACAMVQHLVDRGHRRIAFIAGPESNFEAQERLRGYRAAMGELVPEQAEQVLQGDFSQESGFRAGGRVVALSERPTAVFASNDMMAIGCLSALDEAGLRVPRDIALAGFDDIPISGYLNPPLTTVRVHIAELGGLALKRLASDIEGPQHTAVRHQTLPADLVVRRSTAAPTEPRFLRPLPHAS